MWTIIRIFIVILLMSWVGLNWSIIDYVIRIGVTGVLELEY